VAEEAREGLLRLAAQARVAVVLDDALLEADPRAKAREEPVALGEALQLLDSGTREQPEDARLRRDGEVRHPPEERVERAEHEAAQPGLGARAADREHDLRALRSPRVDEARQELGWVLQVGVHDDDRV